MASISSRSFGTTSRGESVTVYTLENGGITMEVLNYGGTLNRLLVPDADGNLADVVLGFDTISEFEEKSMFFNCIIGRVGNRIGNGKFSLGGVDYEMETNNGSAHLHGGSYAFDKRIWEVTELQEGDDVGLEFAYSSPEGENNYPGNLDAVVRYWLTADRIWRIEYEATTDKPTLYNPTQHVYFNLAGAGSATACDHTLQLNADQFTPTDASQVPTGELRDVAGTPFDFREAKVIGNGIDADCEQIAAGAGYDHNWVLNKSAAGELSKGGTLTDPASGRSVEFWTTEPGVQFYSGNYLDGMLGKDGKSYKRRSGLCLETQHFPDAPNQPNFPSIVLEPGAVFESVTEYRFV